MTDDTKPLQPLPATAPSAPKEAAPKFQDTANAARALLNTAAQQEFLRYEFKYILPKGLRDEIERELGHFIQLDPFVAKSPGRQYFVRSLYFDDPEYTNYYDKVEGVKVRTKFRLRTYDRVPTLNSKIFLELKGRYSQRVFKRRIGLERGEEQKFEVGEQQVAEKILHCIPSGSLRERFEYELKRKKLEPVLLIEYMRRPYVSRFSQDFRLTFDDTLSATKTQSMFPEAGAHRRIFLPGYTVMEVKFANQIPPWFHRVVQNFELKRVPLSKICRGMETWGMVRNPDD